MTSPEFPDLSSMTFEAALAELESIVRQLESGTGKLDDAMTLYARGNALRHHCEKRLQDASLILEKMNVASDGTLSTETFGGTPS